MLFHACPLLHQWSHDHEQAFTTFMQYKTRVPCLLVKGWKSSSGWGFPKGKINEDEPPHTCAIREVLEETGYNLAEKINSKDVIEMSIREQKISLFVVSGVPEGFSFKTKTRKEISKIEWFKLTDLPTWKRSKAPLGKFYLISPFIGPLKAFINERKSRGIRKKAKISPPYHSPNESAQESSSQSSSADNGDPQTPSPQYSAATVNSGPRIMEERSEVPMESMDPHFARLLSSLTLSASTSSREPDERKAKQVPTIEPVSPARSRYSMRSHSARKPSLDVKPMSPLTETPRSPSIAPNTKSSDATQSPAISTARSPRPASRRTSSTADISPYLTRPVELPTSAKQLKQIALLESVVDESTKLVSTLTNHNSTLPTAVDASHPYQPLSSKPPHRVLYNFPPHSLRQGTPLAGLREPLNMPLHGPVPIRSMTSHALYRDATQAWPPSMAPIRSTPEPFPRSHGPMDRATVHNSFLPQPQLGLPLSPSRQFTKPTPTPSVVAAVSTLNPSANSLLSILNSKPAQGLSPTYVGPFTHGRY
ncbi:hypothetical protein AX14_006943 [Amanita brunnescens Koide BX004]|nr:hypothetical protein AX14_006943 [Amanita brunnescens Koide BX004]